MAQAVDWDAGKDAAIAAQYADLRKAVASTGEAKNTAKEKAIARAGLFGTGIKQSDISDFGNIAIRGAEFGEARMGRKMDRATKSFDRRMKADERRAATLQKRIDAGKDPEGTDALELRGLQMGMKERRNSFEDYMGKYQEKGLWGTSFGGDDVGYRTEQSKWNKAMARQKPGSGPGDGDGGQGGMALSADTEHMRRKTEFDQPISPIAQSTPGQSEFEDKFGRGPIGAPKQSSYGMSEFEDKHGKKWGQYDPDLAEPGRPSRGEQWSPDVSDLQASGIEGYGSRPGMMNLGDRDFKKKADLGGRVGTRANPEDTAHMRPRSEFSNKFKQKPSNRYMPGVLRNLTQNQRDRMDVLERQGLIKEKEQALGQQKSEENQIIQDIANKYRRNELTKALRETDWKRG